MSVRREKYDKAKRAAREWHDLYKQSQDEMNRLKKLSEELPDNDKAVL